MIGVIGDFRTDLVNFLAQFPTLNQAKAGKLVSDAEGYVKAKVGEGVMAKVPELKKKIAPPIIAALSLGAFSTILGVWALARTRRRAT